MKGVETRSKILVFVAISFTLLALQGQVAAQHTRYKLIDIGTLGGPASYFTDPGIGPGSQVLNNKGMLAGKATTSTPDPLCGLPNCFGAHVFRWDKGVLTDLGTLPGGQNSDVGGINASGWIAGGSENGDIDPFLGIPVSHAVLWKGDKPLDLGTLGEGLDSIALQVSDGGQVIGISTINTTPDPISGFSGAVHPFLWEKGVLHDLGTLPGDSDAFAAPGCESVRKNLVTGASLGIDPATGNVGARPFLWKDGSMIDLGTFGGTMISGDPGETCVNNRGQVAGAMSLAGDQIFHPFFWDHGVLTDLGILGGTIGQVWWLNDAGDVVGGTTTSGDELFHATIWRKGVIHDLGTLEGDCFSVAEAINSNDQIVGRSQSCDLNNSRDVLWDKDSIVDLSTLIDGNSSLQLIDVRYINDRGEIAGRGLPAGCDDLESCGHDFLLIPCDEAGAQCGANVGAQTPASIATTRGTSGSPFNGKDFAARLGARSVQPFHIPPLPMHKSR
jgi:probable HAF family extracellular repeat protein